MSQLPDLSMHLVHTKPAKFENAPFSLRLGPSLRRRRSSFSCHSVVSLRHSTEAAAPAALLKCCFGFSKMVSRCVTNRNLGKL